MASSGVVTTLATLLTGVLGGEDGSFGAGSQFFNTSFPTWVMTLGCVVVLTWLLRFGAFRGLERGKTGFASLVWGLTITLLDNALSLFATGVVMLRVLLRVHLGDFMFLIRVKTLYYYLLSDDCYILGFYVVVNKFLPMPMNGKVKKMIGNAHVSIGKIMVGN